jgi:hypothetical protein
METYSNKLHSNNSALNNSSVLSSDNKRSSVLRQGQDWARHSHNWVSKMQPHAKQPDKPV